MAVVDEDGNVRGWRFIYGTFYEGPNETILFNCAQCQNDFNSFDQCMQHIREVHGNTQSTCGQLINYQNDFETLIPSFTQETNPQSLTSTIVPDTFNEDSNEFSNKQNFWPNDAALNHSIDFDSDSTIENNNALPEKRTFFVTTDEEDDIETDDDFDKRYPQLSREYIKFQLENVQSNIAPSPKRKWLFDYSDSEVDDMDDGPEYPNIKLLSRPSDKLPDQQQHLNKKPKLTQRRSTVSGTMLFDPMLARRSIRLSRKNAPIDISSDEATPVKKSNRLTKRVNKSNSQTKNKYNNVTTAMVNSIVNRLKITNRKKDSIYLVAKELSFTIDNKFDEKWLANKMSGSIQLAKKMVKPKKLTKTTIIDRTMITTKLVYECMQTLNIWNRKQESIQAIAKDLNLPSLNFSDERFIGCKINHVLTTLRCNKNALE